MVGGCPQRKAVGGAGMGRDDLLVAVDVNVMAGVILTIYPIDPSGFYIGAQCAGSCVGTEVCSLGITAEIT